MNPGDFVEARRRIEAKPRGLRDKRRSAADAAALVRDGDVVALGGCCFSRPPLLLLRELLRQQRRRPDPGAQPDGHRAQSGSWWPARWTR